MLQPRSTSAVAELWLILNYFSSISTDLQASGEEFGNISLALLEQKLDPKKRCNANLKLAVVVPCI